MKKNRFLMITAVFAAVILLTGCNAVDTDQLISELTNQIADSLQVTVTPTPEPDPIATPTPTAVPLPSESRAEAEAAQTFADEYDEAAAVIIDDAIWKALDAMTMSDYRGYTSDVIYSDYSAPYKDVCSRYDRMLDSEYRNFFEAAYEAGTNYEDFYVKDSEYSGNLAIDSINALDVMMLYDFRLQCYYTVMSDGWNQCSCYFDPELDANFPVETGSEEFEEIKRKMSIYDAVIARIVNHMPDKLSTFQKYQYLAYVVSYQCHYTEESEGRRNEHTSYAALIDGSAVCEGYSKAMIELCKAANLACEYESGQTISNREGHMWNLITLEDGTHHIDITWCDGNYEPDNYYWFDYFCRSEEELEEINHMRTEGNLATGPDIYKW